MSKLGPIFTVLVLVGAVIGGFIYHRNLYKITAKKTAIISSSITTAALKSASDTTALYITKLKTSGQVPVKTDTLSNNPEPLFNAAE